MDPLPAAAAVFLVTVCLAGGIGLRFWAWDGRPLERLGQGARPAPARHSSHLDSPVFTGGPVDLVGGGLGRSAPPPADRGIPNPAAVEWLQGAQVSAAVCGGLLALGAAAGAGLQGTNLAASALAAALFGFRLPFLYLGRRTRGRQRQLQRSLPDAVDLMIVSIESGLGLDQAMRLVARELAGPHPEISRELLFVNAEIAAGKTRADALRQLAERTAVDEIRDLASALIQADRFGASICRTLRTVSDIHAGAGPPARRGKSRAPGRETDFPDLFFVLPALFVATLGAVFQLLTELVPMVNNM